MAKSSAEKVVSNLKIEPMFKISKISIYLIIIFILLASAGAVFYFKQQKIKKISNFEQCGQAGYPILESYPAQCRTPDGRIFVQELTDEEKAKLKPPTICKDLCGDGICQEIVCEASGCPCAETKDSCPKDCTGEQSNNNQIANPASTYCLNNGGKLEIRSDASGKQTGYCIFSDKSECEEWAFFRGQCHPKSSNTEIGILEGKVTVGPICPVERTGQPCPVPPEAYTSREVVIFKPDGKTEVTRQHFDTTGHYKFELPTGRLSGWSGLNRHRRLQRRAL